MHKIMNYENIKESLKRVSTLVDDCERNGATAMEYDLILKEIRELYLSVRFGASDAVEVPAAGVEPAVEPAAQSEDPISRRHTVVRSLYDVAEAGAAAGVVAAAAESVAEHPEAEVEEHCEAAVEEHPEVEVGEDPEPEREPAPAPAPAPAPIFEAILEDDEPVMEPSEEESAADETTQMSDEEPAGGEAEESEPEESAEPAKPAPVVPEAPTAIVEDDNQEPEGGEVVLGDVLNADVQTFADTITAADEVVGNGAISSLKDGIGINDRFLLINELFGSGEALDSAIERLDSFDNLNDCMVYIIENYEWNPHSEGAELMMSLIRRRYHN